MVVFRLEGEEEESSLLDLKEPEGQDRGQRVEAGWRDLVERPGGETGWRDLVERLGGETGWREICSAWEDTMGAGEGMTDRELGDCRTGVA